MRSQQQHGGKQGGSNQGSKMRTDSDSTSRKASGQQRSTRGNENDDQPRDAQGRFTDDDSDTRSRSVAGRDGDDEQPRDAQGRFTDDDAGKRTRSASGRGNDDDQPRDEQGRFTDDSESNRSRSRH